MTLMRKIAGSGQRVDQNRYRRWLSEVTGYAAADLEVIQRTLRICNSGQPQNRPVESRWQFGQGPTLWADAPDASGNGYKPQEAVQAVAAAVVEKQPEPVAAAAPSVQPTGTAQSTKEVETFVLNLVSEKTAIRPKCSTWIWTSKAISASTPSSRRNCSPRFANTTAFRAAKTCACRITTRSPK